MSNPSNRVSKFTRQMLSSQKPLVLILVSAPGAGKGTFAQLMSQHYNIPTISTGELVREEIQSNSSIGQSFVQLASSGALIDDEAIISLLQKRLLKDDCKTGFILDGFPRTLTQAQRLDTLTTITCCIEFVLPYEVIIQATTGRRSCKNCKQGYNLANINFNNDQVKIVMPPLLPKVDNTCDSCHCTPIEYIQRSDDKEDVVLSRLETYDHVTKPVLNYYKEQSKLFTHYIQNGKRDWPTLQPILDNLVLNK